MAHVIRPLAAWRRTTKIRTTPGPKSTKRRVIEPIYKQIGEIMREMRLRRGWNGDELGEKLGLTRASISNIENGRQRVMIHDLARIARVLGIPTRDLIPGEWL